MKKTQYGALALGIILAGASMAQAQLFTADFSTDQSANFATVVGGDAGESNANFVYDYSTHVQSAPDTQVAITAAPSGTGTQGLRLNCNLGPGAATVDSISVYPNVSGLTANFSMTFDAWLNHNGNSGGGSGSTNMLFLGVVDSNAAALSTPNTGAGGTATGFILTLALEGGAAQDYRTYIGSGSLARNDNSTLWLGGAAGTNLNHFDPAWSDATTGFCKAPPFQTAGAPDKAWITVKLTVDAGNATLQIKRPGDTAFQPVATTASVPAGSVPVFGFSDINGGVAAPTIDQFVVIDNLVIDNIVSDVSDWSMY